MQNFLNQVILGDCLDTLKTLKKDSVDCLVTDAPYGLSNPRTKSGAGFMGAKWDKVPSVEIWQECLRVLKPGAFAFIMSAPRQDVLFQMITRLDAAGFDVGFTSLYWTYATGMPKGRNVSKAVDRKLGAVREVTGTDRKFGRADSGIYQFNDGTKEAKYSFERTDKPATPEAEKLDGSYAGFQPKPAVEIILVAMKPLEKGSFVSQAMDNGKGVTWLDACRIPFDSERDKAAALASDHNPSGANHVFNPISGSTKHKRTGGNADGRFPANLVVSENVLGATSKFFSLDSWAQTVPFLIVPKASRSERKGNPHLCPKPLKLMAYLITLGSRKGDVVLDPFCGSGSTLVAAKNLERNFIGCELSAEYAGIANARLALN